MKYKWKSVICFIVFVLFVLSNVSASVVTWNWVQNDQKVQYFRYQVDGERPENWTVVRSDVTSYRFENAEDTQEYTLYLQQSYDGRYWSDSSLNTSRALVPGVPALSVSMEILDNEPAAVSAERRLETVFGEIQITATSEAVAISYPEELRPYADLLPAYLTEAYPEIMQYITVSSEAGVLTGDYEFEVTDQSVINSYIDDLAREISILLESIPAAVQLAPSAEVEEAASEIAEIIPEVNEVKDSAYKFSILLKGGVGNRITFQPFEFVNGTNYMRLNVGTALDFSNIISIGRHFGVGLRSDVSTDIIVGPDVGGWSGINKDNFYKLQKSYDYDVSADLKLMTQVEAGPVRFYLGGGLGYSLFNQSNTYEANATHTLKTFKLFGTSFDSAWFASAVTGIGFKLTDVFSLGLEVGYRYMMPAKSHIANTDLVFGFTF